MGRRGVGCLIKGLHVRAEVSRFAYGERQAAALGAGASPGVVLVQRTSRSLSWWCMNVVIHVAHLAPCGARYLSQNRSVSSRFILIEKRVAFS